MTVDGISYNYMKQILDNKSVDEKQAFWIGANNIYKYLKKRGADLGTLYKNCELPVRVVQAGGIGVLSYLGVTYNNVSNYGKLTLAVGNATPVAGEVFYQVLVSTESGEKKAMHIAGNLLMSLFGKDLYVTKKFKEFWQNPEMLKKFGKTVADVEIVAAILRAMEGIGYSKATNIVIDKYGDNLEKFLKQGAEIYEW